MVDEARPPISSEDPDVTRAPSPSGQVGDTIGPYRLLQKVGEGGMGEVWVAEQYEPIRRTVALKVIKLGMDTRQVITRFEAERRVLALMDHPAVAKVLDAGATAHGRPYFVMEYVRGEPITTYCDRQRLSAPERLDLFMRVCDGVQHAHQKGIIHRDLKPSNVLVTLQDGQAVPKIIDFGVAKATAHRLTEHTMFTELGALIGTPEYMSPEQAEVTGLDVDTRTDVYSLGVMLYELLVGALPFDPTALRQAGLDAIRKQIREVDPPRPSARVSTLGKSSDEAARTRHTDPARLAGLLKGDLDWITMKALEKDRTRRYGTASDVAADIRRYLDHQPVLASPPSATYRARKFVRRHRFGVAAAAALVVLLCAFGVTMAVQAQRIARERDRANREAEAARQVTDFMTGLFKVSDPNEARGNSITAREVLDAGAARIDQELTDQPLVQARLMTAMGTVYVGLGLYQRGEVLHRRALAVRQQLLDARAPETLQSLHSLGAALAEQGKYGEAERYTAEALAGRRLVLGPEHPETLSSLNNLNGILFNQGRWVEAESGFRDVLAAREHTLGLNHVDTLAAASNLASVLQVEGKLAEAETIYWRAFDGLRATVGTDHPRTLSVQYNLGTLAEAQERWVEAGELYSDVLERQQRVLGADHADTLGSALALAEVRREERRSDEAEALARDVLVRARRALPRSHPVTAGALVSLGETLNARQRYVEARPLLEEGLDACRTLAPGHGRTAGAQCELGEALRGLRQYGAAEPLLVEGCGGVLASTEPGNAKRRRAIEHVVALYEALGKSEKASEWRKKLPPSK